MKYINRQTFNRVIATTQQSCCSFCSTGNEMSPIEQLILIHEMARGQGSGDFGDNILNNLFSNIKMEKDGNKYLEETAQKLILEALADKKGKNPNLSVQVQRLSYVIPLAYAFMINGANLPHTFFQWVRFAAILIRPVLEWCCAKNIKGFQDRFFYTPNEIKLSKYIQGSVSPTSAFHNIEGFDLSEDNVDFFSLQDRATPYQRLDSYLGPFLLNIINVTYASFMLTSYLSTLGSDDAVNPGKFTIQDLFLLSLPVLSAILPSDPQPVLRNQRSCAPFIRGQHQIHAHISADDKIQPSMLAPTTQSPYNDRLDNFQQNQDIKKSQLFTEHLGTLRSLPA